MFDFLKAKQPAKPIERITPTIGNLAEYNNVPSSDAVRMGQIFEIGPTSAGVNVTEFSAMRVSAVAACVRLISGAISSMPCSIYERQADGGRLPVKHDYWWLLNEQPCDRFSAATFWEFCASQVLLRGDGISMIVRREPSPRAFGLIPIKRANVGIRRVADRLQYLVTDEVQDQDGSKKTIYFTLDQDDVLHFPGFGFDGISSPSVIGIAARQAIGTAIQADNFAGQFYGSGAQLQHVIKVAGKFSPEQQEAMRTAFVAKYSGGQGPTGIPLVLTEGTDIKEMSMSAVDAQLLESRKYQVVDVARAFGVPPFMIGDVEKTTSWGTGIEQLGIGFVKYTLQPYLRRFEQELNRKLFPKNDRYFVEFNTDGLMRGDATARSAYYKAALGGTQAPAWMTQNEVRKLDNLPPMEGGDELHDPTGVEPPPEPTGPDATVLALAGISSALCAISARDNPAPHVTVSAPVVNVTMPEVRTDVAAPVVNVATPDVHIQNTMPEQPAPVVNVTVEPSQVRIENVIPEQPAPVVNVAAPFVNITNEVQPADVRVELPSRITTGTIERDANGNIIRTTQIEKDL